MTSQVDGMRRLVESLVASAEEIVAGEAARLEQADADSQVRVEDIAVISADVAQMRADTNAAVAAAEAGRIEQAAADADARADAEAARLEQADADSQVRVADIAVISADVAQMRADTNEAVADLSESRIESAELLQTGLRAMNEIRRGMDAAPVPSKAKAKAKAKSAPAGSSGRDAAPTSGRNGDWDQERRPTRAEIFSFIADHPDGVSLVDMEEHFGTPRIVLQRPVKEMYEVDHEVSRDEESGRYFAV